MAVLRHFNFVHRNLTPEENVSRITRKHNNMKKKPDPDPDPNPHAEEKGHRQRLYLVEKYYLRCTNLLRSYCWKLYFYWMVKHA